MIGVVEEGTAMLEVCCLVPPPPQLLSSPFKLAEVAARWQQDDVSGPRDVLYSIDFAACEWYWSDSGHQAKACHDLAAHTARRPKRQRFSVAAKSYRMIASLGGMLVDEELADAYVPNDNSTIAPLNLPRWVRP